MKRTAPPYRHGVPPRLLRRLERILQHGAAKYGEPRREDWYDAYDIAVVVQEHLAGALRHMGRAGAWGENHDLETGERHLLHAAARLILLVSLLDYEPLTPCKENRNE